MSQDNQAVEEILSCIQGALELVGNPITMESSMENIAEWDSFGHLSILVALDKKFDGKVAAIDEMASAGSVKKIVSLLKEHSLL